MTSAILRLRAGNIPGNGTYTLYDVTTPVTALRTGGSGLTDIYADMGSGTRYGGTALTSMQTSGLVDITLNADAIAAINARPGLFALAGTYDTPDSFAFGGTDADERRQLRLETNAVPEPASMALVGLGLCAIFGARKRKNPRPAHA